MNSTDILNPNFEKKFGGYKQDSVDVFLEDVASAFAALENENEALNRKIAVLAKKIEEYRSDESNMKEALLGAQKLGATVVKEAEEKAESIIEDATAQAQALLEQAKTDDERMRAEMKIEIHQQKQLLMDLEKEVSDFKSKLLKSYKVHTDLISALPDQGYYTDKYAADITPISNEEEPQNSTDEELLSDNTVTIEALQPNEDQQAEKNFEESIADEGLQIDFLEQEDKFATKPIHLNENSQTYTPDFESDTLERTGDIQQDFSLKFGELTLVDPDEE